MLKPKKCKAKIKEILNNNHLPFNDIKKDQLENYLHHKRSELITSTYPELKQFLTEICNKKYAPNLNDDETFFIHTNVNRGELSLLFSTRQLLTNIIRQSRHEKCFIHLDGTYKLIDLRIPLIVVSTETKEHKFRPICFFVTWSEKTDQFALLLRELSKFYREHLDYSFKPEFVLSDNSDAIIAGCRNAFAHEYQHLLCHFHIMKGVRQKLQKRELSGHKAAIYFGLKLRGSENQHSFDHNWKIVKNYWTTNRVCKKFTDTFEKEYILKRVCWYYGAGFAGKSRSNNSLESGNKLIKDHFNRKSENLKEFLIKMQEFLREFSTLEKSNFPSQPLMKDKIRKAGIELSKDEDKKFLEYNNDQTKLYYPRKGFQNLPVETLIRRLHIFIQNKDTLSQDINQLFEHKQYFRTINMINKTCSCSNFAKYGYCKHIICLKILDGELEDPIYQARRRPGRRARITSALRLD